MKVNIIIIFINIYLSFSTFHVVKLASINCTVLPFNRSLSQQVMRSSVSVTLMLTSPVKIDDSLVKMESRKTRMSYY